MNKTTMILLGGLGIAGIYLVVVASKKSNAQQPSLAAVSPLQVPQFPPAPALPPLMVNASPSYMYFNVPENRNLLPTKKNDNACGCSDGCGDALVAQQNIPQAVVEANAKKLVKRFSLGPNPSAMLSQFPPALYPWLYQNGGTA